MKRKVIIILTTATAVLGVYVVVDKLGLLGEGKEDLVVTNNLETNEIVYNKDDVEEEVEEIVKKEIRYLSEYELDQLKVGRNPFVVSPEVEKQNEYKEKEKEEIMKRIDSRIQNLKNEEEKKIKEAEKNKKEYKTNQKEFDKKVEEEINKMLSGVKYNVSSGLKLENKTEDVQINALVEEYSKKYNINKNLILAIIGDKKIEDKNFTFRNQDGTYTKGLMQISERTAKWVAKKLGEKYKKDMEYDAATNIRYGTYYLNYLKKINNDETYMATAYYLGPNGAEKYYQKNKTYVSTFSAIIEKRK